jgi:tol-pal system protein YbgF
MLKNKTLSFGVGLALALTYGSALAEYIPPVVDLSQGGYAQDQNSTPTAIPTVDASNLPMPDRLNRLEQQVNNIIQMNLPQQVSELQQQVQQLSGQVQDLAHQLDQASRQQQHVEALPAVPPISETPPNPAIVTAAKAPPSDAPPHIPPGQTDASAYERAFGMLSNKQYDQAAVAFKDYLINHPDGQFVANAHYWLGDIYFQQKNLKQAELELNLVITQYASSGKAPDAKLKLALIHAQQGDADLARQELQNIQSQYPGSSAAQLANIQLQQLNSGK